MNDQVNKVQNQSASKKKRERRPLTASRTLLDVRGKEPGFHYCWVNEANVFAYQEAGYEHVRHPVQVGSNRIDVSQLSMDSHVVVNVGGGKKAFLMRQPDEFYEEDQQAESQKADEQLRARVGDFNKDGLTGSIDAYVTAGR
jgi:hypothetical protein